MQHIQKVHGSKLTVHSKTKAVRSSIFNLQSSICLALLILFGNTSFGQSYTPCSTAVKVNNFGLDGDVTANTPASILADDWFLSAAYPGAGIGVIGTTAATAKPPISAAAFKAIIQAATSPSGRNLTYQQGMSVPGGTVVNGELLIDAFAARDNISPSGAVDSSMFQGNGNKNGINPTLWTLGVSSIQNKNDLIDVGGHLRIDIATNHLICYGFASTLATSGDAHTDFEFFRTMPTFDAVKKGGVTGSGPAATGGHTTWILNSDGSLKQSGDILLSVDYSTGGVTVSASVRVWVNPNDVDGLGLGHDTAYINAQANRIYTFTGIYDTGAGANGFGYAEITPVNPTSAQCLISAVENKTTVPGTAWGNLYGSSGQYADNLSTLQLVEVSIDFTAFGLGQNNVSGACDIFLMDMLIKTRSSGSFTASLKDYAGPYHLFMH